MIGRIGKYTIIRELGRGTTASVYLADDPFARRQVAVKVAFPEILKNPERGTLYTHLFLNEASLVGKLQHPHIVQIYDAVVADGLCYIVMEYVAGGTLEAHCDADRLLPIERVVEIVFKCTRALDHAFRIGITHRDIKPANILFSGNLANSGDVKISDFGAAIIDNPERTQVSGVGSPAYMSPQQLKEQALDQQTDIYSLGVVMYQLLTGQLPFQATTSYQMIYQIINSEPASPSSLRRAIPEVLDRVVARAMCKDTRQRYQDWQEFAHDLVAAYRNAELKAVAQGFAEAEQFHLLRNLPFFVHFTDAEIWEVLEISYWLSVAPEQTIIDDGDIFYFVAEGEFAATTNGTQSRLLSRGDCFGEKALIGGQSAQHQARFTARVRSRLLAIRREAVQQAQEACRMHFYQSLSEVLSRRLEQADARQLHATD